VTATVSSIAFGTVPLCDAFGVETGVDLSTPPSGPEFDRIYEAFLAH
jgi:hypothetical protein